MIATRKRPARRALTTAAALLFVAAPLSACTSHATDTIYQPAQGANARGSEVDVLNALVVSGAEGEGRFIAGLANTGTEANQLTNISGAGESSVEVQLTGGDTEVPGGGFLQLADPEAAQVTVSGEDVAAGGYVRLLLEFAQGDAVEVNAPVVEPGEDFGGVVTASPSETPTESPTESTESHSE